MKFAKKGLIGHKLRGRDQEHLTSMNYLLPLRDVMRALSANVGTPATCAFFGLSGTASDALERYGAAAHRGRWHAERQECSNFEGGATPR